MYLLCIQANPLLKCRTQDIYVSYKPTPFLRGTGDTKHLTLGGIQAQLLLYRLGVKPQGGGGWRLGMLHQQMLGLRSILRFSIGHPSYSLICPPPPSKKGLVITESFAE